MRSDRRWEGGAGRPPLFPSILVVGDIAVFLLFAAVGRRSHGESGGNAIASTIGVALPFIAGWFLAAVPTGGLSPAALRSVRTAVRHVVVAWIPGALIGLGIRSILEGRIVPWTFALITVLFNLLVLSGWRSVLTLSLQRRR